MTCVREDCGQTAVVHHFWVLDEKTTSEGREEKRTRETRNLLDSHLRKNLDNLRRERG